MNVAQDRLAQEARPDAQPLATELLFAFLSLIESPRRLQVPVVRLYQACPAPQSGHVTQVVTAAVKLFPQ